jgi:hypothetical protein
MYKVRWIAMAALLAAVLMTACGGGSGPGYIPGPVLVQYIAGAEVLRGIGTFPNVAGARNDLAKP